MRFYGWTRTLQEPDIYLSGSFRNLTTSFQVKADLDLRKFSRMEPVSSTELTFDQWRIDVHSYQINKPEHILLPAI